MPDDADGRSWLTRPTTDHIRHGQRQSIVVKADGGLWDDEDSSDLAADEAVDQPCRWAPLTLTL